MATWRLAPTLVQLKSQINALYPLRDKTSDGTLGNASHAASVSDHNPDERRVVCAIDVDEDLDGSANKVYPRFNSGKPAKERLLDRLLKLAKAGLLPQLRYMIYEGKIYRDKTGWVAEDYDGPNAHDHHLHISVYHEARLADRTTPWFSKLDPIKVVVKNTVGTVYHVDPAKVSTSLVGVTKAGANRTEHKPGTNLRIVRFAYLNGRKWAVTPTGIYYAAAFLKKGSA